MRDVRDDHLLGLGLVQEDLVDQQGRIEGLRLRQTAIRSVWTIPRPCAPRSDPTSLSNAAGSITARSADSVGRPTSRAAKRASPPTATNESISASGRLCSVATALAMCCRSRSRRTPRRFLAGGKHLLQPDRAQPQALGGGNFAVFQQRQAGCCPRPRRRSGSAVGSHPGRCRPLAERPKPSTGSLPKCRLPRRSDGWP